MNRRLRIFAAVCLSVIVLTSCWKQEQPKIYWKLPNGDTVVFYHSPSDFLQSDHDKNLELRAAGKSSYVFQFGGAHSGYKDVELRMSSDKSIIWIVDQRDGMIGGRLNLETKEFEGEGNPYKYDKDGVELFGAKRYNNTILKKEPTRTR